MSLDDQCLTKVPDCEQNSVAIANFCYPIKTDTYSSNNKFIKQKYDIIWTEPNNSQDGITLFDCASQCGVDSECNYFKFLYGSSGIENKETATGLCRLYNTNYDDNSDITYKLPINSTTNAFDLGYSNASIYKKDDTYNSSSNEINLCNDNKCVSIDITNPTYKVLTPLIGTKYLGKECRINASKDQLIDDTANQTMAAYCNNNPDLKVCNTYCNSNTGQSYCSMSIPSFIFIYLILGLICLFFVLFIWVKRYQLMINNKSYRNFTVISLLVLAVIFFGLFIYYLIKYKTPWNGQEADTTNWDSFNSCDNYPSVLNNTDFSWYTPCAKNTDSYCFKDSFKTEHTYSCSQQNQDVFGNCSCQSEPTRKNNSTQIIGKDGNFSTGVVIDQDNDKSSVLYNGSVYENTKKNDCGGIDLSDGMGCVMNGVKMQAYCPAGTTFQYNNTCGKSTKENADQKPQADCDGGLQMFQCCDDEGACEPIQNIEYAGKETSYSDDNDGTKYAGCPLTAYINDKTNGYSLLYTKQYSDISDDNICQNNSPPTSYNIDKNGLLIPYTRNFCDCYGTDPTSYAGSDCACKCERKDDKACDGFDSTSYNCSTGWSALDTVTSNLITDTWC